LSSSPISGFDLWKRFVKSCNGVWKPGTSVPVRYCLETLIPIGLVATEDVLYSGAKEYVVGFRLTKAGERYGQPIAAFLLEQSGKLPASLFTLSKVFGATSSAGGETRPVLNRVKILEFLYQADYKEQGNVRETDISKQLNRKRNDLVGGHLSYLNKLGLANYSFVLTEKRGFAKYRLLENAKREDVRTVITLRSLTQDVADLLFQLKRVDCNEIAERLKNKYSGKNETSLRQAVSRILSGLEKQGICKHESYVGGKILSQARITDVGKQVVENIILPIKQALSDDDDLLSSWRRIPWQNYAISAISKHKESSRFIESKSFKEWEDKCLSIISQNPGLRPREIISILGRRNTSDLLRSLLDKGKVKRERKGCAVYYYPVETNK
jgi:DNA-binding PadR family transcriptional regulator